MPLEVRDSWKRSSIIVLNSRVLVFFGEWLVIRFRWRLRLFIWTVPCGSPLKRDILVWICRYKAWHTYEHDHFWVCSHEKTTTFPQMVTSKAESQNLFLQLNIILDRLRNDWLCLKINSPILGGFATDHLVYTRHFIKWLSFHLSSVEALPSANTPVEVQTTRCLWRLLSYQIHQMGWLFHPGT